MATMIDIYIGYICRMALWATYITCPRVAHWVTNCISLSTKWRLGARFDMSQNGHLVLIYISHVLHMTSIVKKDLLYQTSLIVLNHHK